MMNAVRDAVMHKYVIHGYGNSINVQARLAQHGRVHHAEWDPGPPRLAADLRLSPWRGGSNYAGQRPDRPIRSQNHASRLNAQAPRVSEPSASSPRSTYARWFLPPPDACRS